MNLSLVWDLNKYKKYTDAEMGKPHCKCHFCSCSQSGHIHTKALLHLIHGSKDVKTCKWKIDAKWRKMFNCLLKTKLIEFWTRCNKLVNQILPLKTRKICHDVLDLRCFDGKILNIVVLDKQGTTIVLVVL